jgi:hypothetical protein
MAEPLLFTIVVPAQIVSFCPAEIVMDGVVMIGRKEPLGPPSPVTVLELNVLFVSITPGPVGPIGPIVPGVPALPVGPVPPVGPVLPI